MPDEITTLMLQALKACRAWHDAERNSLGDFYMRSDLCAYSEWLTRKAIAAAEHAPFDEPFMGPPSLIIWPACELARATEADASDLVAAIEAHGIAKKDGAVSHE